MAQATDAKGIRPMTWESWKADLIALVIILLIVAPFALYGPLWLRNQGQGGPIKSSGVSVTECRWMFGKPTIEPNGGVTCELEK